MSSRPRSRCGNRAEEPVRLAVRTGREEQRVDRAVVDRPVPELQRPEPVDDELPSVHGPERPDELERPVGQLLVRVHMSVAEVAYEQVTAERSETRRGEREAPRRIQLAMLCHTREQIPVRLEGVDEAEALAVDLVLRPRALLRVRHEDSRADRLNSERRVACGDLRIDESARGSHGYPRRVNDIDPDVVEVRAVDVRPPGRRPDREAV